MATTNVVIDACCTLNLLATRRDCDIVRALNWYLFDTPFVSREAHYLWTAPADDGERTKEPASTATLRSEGLLTTHALDTDALMNAFADAASRINDSDASCIALAGVLEYPLVSDDRKERRVARELFPKMQILSTLDMLYSAASALCLSSEELSQLANTVRWSGNFAPPRTDPRAEWYAALLRKT